MLYLIKNFNSFSKLTENELNILKNYDIFYFYKMYVKESEIEKFNNLLYKYFIILKLNNCNIEYIPFRSLIKNSRIFVEECLVDLDDIDSINYKNIFSLKDILDIKNILINNLSDFSFSISLLDFYFKSYNDAKSFLKNINKNFYIQNIEMKKE